MKFVKICNLTFHKIFRKERKKIKKDRSNTFREKFKSIKVKKKEKESKEKSKEKDKEKEEKKEKKEKKKHKRSLSAGATLASVHVQSPPPGSYLYLVRFKISCRAMLWQKKML